MFQKDKHCMQKVLTEAAYPQAVLPGGKHKPRSEGSPPLPSRSTSMKSLDANTNYLTQNNGLTQSTTLTISLPLTHEQKSSFTTSQSGTHSMKTLPRDAKPPLPTSKNNSHSAQPLSHTAKSAEPCPQYGLHSMQLQNPIPEVGLGIAPTRNVQGGRNSNEARRETNEGWQNPYAATCTLQCMTLWMHQHLTWDDDSPRGQPDSWSTCAAGDLHACSPFNE